MKNFINITVFVPAVEPADEEDGIIISIDKAGIVALTPEFYDGASHGTFDGNTLVNTLNRVMTAFRSARHILDPGDKK